jgi:hypothetical protein
MSSYAEIVTAESVLENAKRLYLKRFGWTETSNTPGSFWLWTRDFADVDAVSAKWHEDHPKASPHAPYGKVMASTDTAIRMTTAALDQDEESEAGE